jgi:hypothetical protein
MKQREGQPAGKRILNTARVFQTRPIYAKIFSSV